MKHIKGLDTLRAFAVLFVIVQHWGPDFSMAYPTGRFIRIYFIPSGAFGVYLFFTLSGFLITSILLNARFSSNDTGSVSIIKNFFARRVLRIFPIYYLMIFILLCVYPQNIKEYIGYLLTYSLNFVANSRNNFTSFFAHSWTLDVEEQFYLFWPWLILFIRRKYLSYVFICAIIAGIISSYFTLAVNHRIEPFLMTDCLDCLALGGFYAYARQNETSNRKFETLIKWFSPVFLLIYFYWKYVTYNQMAPHGMFFEKTIDSFISIGLIMLVINNKSGFLQRNLLENKFLNFIGKISYGIYIYHPYIKNINEPIKSFFNKQLLHNSGWHNTWYQYLFLYVTDFAVLIFVCWLSYVLIESPVLKLKKYFRYKDGAR